MMWHHIAGKIQLDLLIRSNSLHFVDDIPNKWPGIEESEAHAHLTRFNAANINQIIQKGIQPLGLGLSPCKEVAIDRWVINCPIEKCLEEALYGEDRGSQLMAYIGKKLASDPLQLLHSGIIVPLLFGYLINDFGKRL